MTVSSCSPHALIELKPLSHLHQFPGKVAERVQGARFRPNRSFSTMIARIKVLPRYFLVSKGACTLVILFATLPQPEVPGWASSTAGYRSPIWPSSSRSSSTADAVRFLPLGSWNINKAECRFRRASFYGGMLGGLRGRCIFVGEEVSWDDTHVKMKVYIPSSVRAFPSFAQ